MSSPDSIMNQGIPLEGRLSDPATLPRLLAWLARGDWSGMIVLRAGDTERRLYFAEGRLSTAGSNDSSDALATHLIRDGLISEEDRSRAAGQLRTTDRGWSFGRQLVKLGLLSEHDLARAERRRVLSIARVAIGLRSGQYACESGAVAGDAMPNQALEVPRVVAEGMLTTWEANSALDVLGGRGAVLDLVAETLSDYEATGAEEEYDATFLRCNGKRSVQQVLDMSPLPEAAALRFLAALRLLGCVSSVPGVEQEYDPEATVPSEKVSDETLSANLDERSLFLNFELMVAFYDSQDIAAVTQWIDGNFYHVPPYQPGRASLLRDIAEGLVRWLGFQI